ncbi:LacI family DNA-binding transcriptional regulator [Silvimonas amylolytica]|uniref:LacI family transcriptional regulator n=1 Tax=Silvimonas amylolytica TaxID=449663 RepID=A0ABQ2PJ70_9NEIS|nr:LacI family DNA-binding transcriptional regulator [Silvimonas amylolytica]GGP25314.1 LacI family transcriptional regulator [Silvimonas amylolytica]
MATIKEVAAHAGVTPTTVTNVLRGRGRVGDATRDRVLAAVAATNYHPNLNARALVERKSPTLALMLGCLTNPFYPEFTLQAHLAARSENRFLLICNTDYEEDGGRQFLNEVAGSLSDGVLVANKGNLNLEQFKSIEKRGVPVVISIWEDPAQHPGIPCIAFDSTKAGKMATQHLIDLGHQHIGALIASPAEGIHAGRYAGYRDALEEANLPVKTKQIRFCEDTYEDGYRTAFELLTTNKGMTALFVSNDLPAIGVLDAAAEMGLRVPEDISVVSVTNIHMASQSRPGLTTVAIPTTEMAFEAIEMLLELTRNKPAQPPMKVIEKLRLVERHSTGAPKA